MARKELGHIELQWQCPNCDGINLGREETCSSCGAPQPENVEFKQYTRQELLKDEKLITRAKAGADIHCAYCGTRNPATAEACSQCGSDISEGAKREAGRVVGAFETGPEGEVACPSCGSLNPTSALMCANCGGTMRVGDTEFDEEKPAEQGKPRRRIPVVFIVIAVLLCVSVVVFMILSGRTTAVSGVVQGVQWERSIPIEAFGPVEHEDWHDAVPTDAENISCQEEYRYTSDSPVGSYEEVCGTPYTEDTGSGFAEVVQDCEYRIFEDNCSYTVDEWSVVDTAVLTGSDYSPIWPEPSLGEGQRLGENRTETYSVTFAADNETYSFEPENINEFTQYQIGSSWNLNVNTFGILISVEP
jgi:ribosomal protein L40E